MVHVCVTLFAMERNATFTNSVVGEKVKMFSTDLVDCSSLIDFETRFGGRTTECACY